MGSLDQLSKMWSSLRYAIGEIATAAQSGQRPKQLLIKVPQGWPTLEHRRRDCLERVRIWLQACDPKRRIHFRAFKTGRFSTDGVPAKINTYPLFAEHFSPAGARSTGTGTSQGALRK